jgi:hypothetical protein
MGAGQHTDLVGRGYRIAMILKLPNVAAVRGEESRTVRRRSKRCYLVAHTRMHRGPRREPGASNESIT